MSYGDGGLLTLMGLEVSNGRIAREAGGKFILRAYAKLNLGLRVFPMRADGFHDVETWMVSTSWHDTLTISGEGKLELLVTGRAEGIPTDVEKNLAGRAALKLAAAAGREATGRIELHKVLPPGGGIGGGSSDAANVLVGLNLAWGLNFSEGRLRALAAELGSDIPFFISGKPSLCTGRGEIMTDLALRNPLFAVLIIPPMGCPTKEVYQAFDGSHQHPTKILQQKTDWAALAGAPAEALNQMLINDLEPAAFYIAPALAMVRKRAQQIAQQPVHLTGSGSTLFTLASSGAAASLLEERLNADLGEGCVCVAVRILSGSELSR